MQIEKQLSYLSTLSYSELGITSISTFDKRRLSASLNENLNIYDRILLAKSSIMKNMKSNLAIVAKVTRILFSSTLKSLLCTFLLFHALRHIWQEPSIHPILFIYYLATLGPQSLISSGYMTRSISWPDAASALCSPSYSLSSCLSHPLISFSLQWGRTVIPKFFDTQVPSVSTEELVLSGHPWCVPSSSLQRPQPSVELFLESAELKNLRAAPVIILLQTLLFSLCPALLQTLYDAYSLATLHLVASSRLDLKESPRSWGSDFPP